MPTHQGEKASVFSALGVQLLPDLEEVVVDEADDVEAVSHDLCILEETFCDPAVGFGKVHDDDADLGFVEKPSERGFQSQFRASEEDVVDPVFGEIAEGGGVSFFSGEKMFVDSQDSWAGVVLHLRELMLEEVVVAAFDSCLSNRELF